LDRPTSPLEFLASIIFLSVISLQITGNDFTNGKYHFVIPEADGHTSGIFLMAYTEKPPIIDGILESAEWSKADMLDNSIGTIYVMNDDTNLYIALKISDNSLDERSVSIFFDNVHNGQLDVGDDIISYSGSFSDEYVNFKAPGTFGWGKDDNGLLDGDASANSDGINNFYEFSHPLCSSDKSQDFCLEIGDIAGLSLRYIKNRQSNDWPASLGLDTSGWGDIAILGPDGKKILPPTIPPKYEICGDSADNDSDGQVDEADGLAQPGINWSSCMMQNVSLQNASLQGANLQFADLSGANLTDADLSNADLSGTNLSGADLRNSNFNRAILKWVDLQASDLQGANLQFADLSGAHLGMANLNNADLSNVILIEATLSGTNITNTIIQGADLSSAYLSGMDLKNLVFTNVKLHMADLSGTNLENADLSYQDLSETGLNDANLQNANLQGSELTRANLVGSDLSDADLYVANLRFALLDGTDLSGTTLDGPIIPWYTGINLKQGDYFKYKMCYVELNNCNPFEMDFWTEESTNEYSSLEIQIIDDGKITSGSVKIDPVTAKILELDKEPSIFLKGYDHLTFFSLLANKTEPRDFDATTWYSPQAPKGPFQILGNETVSTLTTEFDTQLRGVKNQNFTFWVAKDFPFPVKGTYKIMQEENPVFDFQLLEYGNSPSSPFVKDLLTELIAVIALVCIAAGIVIVYMLKRRKKRTLISDYFTNQ